MKPPGGPLPAVDFAVAPFLVIWETTQACALACRHCRASARPERDPLELSMEEGFDVIDQVADMGTPLLVLTGGDPLNRPDLLPLIRHAKKRRLRVATIPAATERLTEAVVASLKEAGLDQMALSLDFPDAVRHDAFRGVPGAFVRTLAAAKWARKYDLPLQINTTVCGDTASSLEEMGALVEELGVVFWEVFFLVPTGRGSELQGLSAGECERLFAVIDRVQRRSSFIVKVTEAPHYRRFVAQRERREAGGSLRHPGMAVMPEVLTRSEGPGHTVGLAPRGVNSGNGFLFVSHRGEIYPSGFLPESAGSIRSRSLADAYRHHVLFARLRRPTGFDGRCGRCEYADICGGSRSRAFALTGDPLASDPWCVYEPAVIRVGEAQPLSAG
ncbi:MAG TPA: TIGR04053 family radical SAM/SPASM domain-containing protein, partial [Vicinamibacteria bacterium]